MEKHHQTLPVLELEKVALPPDDYETAIETLPVPFIEAESIAADIRRYNEIPFEVVTPTIERHTQIIERVVVVRETPQYVVHAPTPTPTYYADSSPTFEDVGAVARSVGRTLGAALLFLFSVCVGVLSVLAELLSAIFDRKTDTYQSYAAEKPDLWKQPKIQQGGNSTNTVRDINISVHVGENN